MDTPTAYVSVIKGPNGFQPVIMVWNARNEDYVTDPIGPQMRKTEAVSLAIEEGQKRGLPYRSWR